MPHKKLTALSPWIIISFHAQCKNFVNSFHKYDLPIFKDTRFLARAFFKVWQKFAGTKSAALVIKNACVKEFIHVCSENRTSWIYGLFLENTKEWKQHPWNWHEPRIRWIYIFLAFLRKGPCRSAWVFFIQPMFDNQQRSSLLWIVMLGHGSCWSQLSDATLMYHNGVPKFECRRRILQILNCVV